MDTLSTAGPARGAVRALLTLLLAGGGCASTVEGVAADAAMDHPDASTSLDASWAADVLPPDGSAIDRQLVPCRPPSDGRLRSPPAGPDAVIDVAEDTTFGCVLRGDGRIRCRGEGLLRGAFADGAEDSGGMLRTVTLPLDDVRSFGMSLHRGCAVRGDGSLWCWGDNTVGSVHPDLPRRMLTPTRVPGIEGARRVWTVLSLIPACVLLEGGRVVCWDGSGDPPTVLVERGATDVALASSHRCVRFDDASARCTMPSVDGPTEVALARGDAEAVAAGIFNVCAIDRRGVVTCWGEHYPSTDIRRGPFDDGVRCATSVALGFTHVCASTTDGTVTCWGGNGFGELGASRSDAAPAVVPGVDRVVRVLRGMVSTCALRDDGSLWCWGSGYLASDRRSPGPAGPHPLDW